MTDTNTNSLGSLSYDNMLKPKKLAIISSAIKKNLRAHILSTLTNGLIERGWEITIITAEAQSGEDFLISNKIKRISIVGSTHNKGYRASELSRLSKELDVSAFLFWNCNRMSLLEDYECIKNCDKEIYFSYEDSLAFMFYPGSVETYNLQEGLRRKVSGTATPFPLDELTENIIASAGRTVCIPLLHPYIKGDLRPAVLKKNEILVFASNEDYQLEVVFAAFKSILGKFPKAKLKIIECFNEFTVIQKAVLNSKAAELGISNFIIWEGYNTKPHKLMNNLTCAVLPENDRQYPKLLPEAVCRGIPTIVIKNGADYEPLYSWGYAGVNENDVDGLAAEFSKLMDDTYRKEMQEATFAIMEKEYTDNIFDRWEKFLQGEILDQVKFEHKEKAISCAIRINDVLLKTCAENWAISDRFNYTLCVRLVKGIKSHCERFKESQNIFVRIIKAPFKLVDNGYRHLRMLENRRLLSTIDIFIPNETRRKLQLLILKMYIEFDRICKKNNLTYYLAAGSILGAVRHHGFIPWDDDMDITMPRKDYDKFLKIVDSQMQEEFCFNKDAYPYTFSRLELKGTRETAPLQRKGRHIFLDILPLDCAAPNKKKQKFHEIINKKIITCMFTRSRKMPAFRLSKYKTFSLTLFLKIFFPHWLMLLIWKKNAKRFLSDDATHWVCLPGFYGYDGERFPVEYWGEPFMVNFEGITIPTMNHWHDYLFGHYGDYMQPIPLAHRRLQHRIFSISLGKYDPMTVAEVEKNVEDFYTEIHKAPFKLHSDV